MAAVTLALAVACAGLAVHYWPAHRGTQTPMGLQDLQLSDSVLRSATTLVFGPTATYHVQRVGASPNLGGASVDISTLHGSLTLLQPGGQIIAGGMTDVRSGVPLVSPDVAVATASTFVARVFPWARSLPVGPPALIDHGSGEESYELTWRATVNGVMQPSWVSVTTNEAGQVLGFAANSFPSVPMTVAVDQVEAVAIAQKQAAAGSTLAHADLRQGMRAGVMRTYWTIDLAPPTPTQTGYAQFGVTSLEIDAVTGQVIR
jgi:hypothetical protein